MSKKVRRGSAFEAMMVRLQETGSKLEHNAIEVKVANAISSNARTWISMVNLVLRVNKAASPRAMKYLED
jgi:hypothetical protein